MQKTFSILGIAFIVITIINVVLYIKDVKGVKLEYCFGAMIICLLLFAARNLVKK